MPTRKKSSSNKQAVASPQNIESEETPTKPKHFKKEAQDQIGKSYKKIVEKLAEEAEKGSVRHTKVLFDLGGVKEELEAVKPKRRKRASLGQLLLKEVETMKNNKAPKPPAEDSNPS